MGIGIEVNSLEEMCYNKLPERRSEMAELIKPDEMIVDGGYEKDSVIVDRNTPVDPAFGIKCVKLTSEHIKALKNGKCIYFEDGEYATVLYYEKADNKPFPSAGQGIKMLVDGEWKYGKVIKGYRYKDGIVTMEDECGNKYWCGESRTDLYMQWEKAVQR